MLYVPPSKSLAGSDAQTCRTLGRLPSPLWGGAGGGGRELRRPKRTTPPPPTLPHKGGGSKPSLQHRCAHDAPSQLRLLPDNDLGPDRYAIVQVRYIAVDEAEAARGHGAADGLRLVRAVNAIDRGAEIERTRTHGVAGASGHEARQIGLALD